LSLEHEAMGAYHSPLRCARARCAGTMRHWMPCLRTPKS
jgi:hypothetical protein